MKKSALRITAVAALAALGAPAFAAANFDANVELDTTYQNNNRGLDQGGRVEFNASQKVGPDAFVAGRATLLAKKDGSAGTDDMWVQAGTSAFDVKLGRFEAMNLFPLQRDTYVPFAGFAPYQGNTLRGRGFVTGTSGLPQGPSGGDGVVHLAATVNAMPGLAVEIGVVEAKQDLNGAGVGKNKGIRPAVSYTSGPLSVQFGIEAIKYGTNLKSRTGFSGSVGYDIGGGFVINGNYAQVKTDTGEKAKTFGLIFNQPMGVGGGLVMGDVETATGKAKVTTGYLTYEMSLLGIKGATIVPALAFSNASGENNAKDDKGIRVRIHYDF